MAQVCGDYLNRKGKIWCKTKHADTFWALVKTVQTLHHGATWVGLVVPIKQKIEACRLNFKIERTPENRLVNKIFKWSSMHGKSWERRFQSFMWSNNLQTYL